VANKIFAFLGGDPAKVEPKKDGHGKDGHGGVGPEVRPRRDDAASGATATPAR